MEGRYRIADAYGEFMFECGTTLHIRYWLMEEQVDFGPLEVFACDLEEQEVLRFVIDKNGLIKREWIGSFENVDVVVVSQRGIALRCAPNGFCVEKKAG